MVKVRILVSIVGDRTWNIGDVVELSEQQAAAWADGVRAERIRSVAPETVAVEPAENAAAIARRPRGRRA